MELVTFLWLLTFSLQQDGILSGQQTKRIPNVPFWQEVNSWSKCSTTCGEGTQEKLFDCFQKTFYLIENIPREKCFNVEKPKPKYKKCNYGNCDQSFFWKTTEWGKCSHTCGYAGVQTSDVECFQKLDTGKFIATDPEKCLESAKPKHLRSCNRFNCPVNFQANRWENCIKSSDCSPGKQRRNLTCVSLLSSGKILYLPRAACYQKGIVPPASWRKCFDHVDNEKCFAKKAELPQITESKQVLVQMRRINKLELKVGNIAYIIPGTKVMITCPVKYFLKMNLLWKYKKDEYAYKGKSKNRIKVNKKGKITIKSFMAQDQGEWICQAGNTKSTIVMKLKSPSEGFKDWAIRNTLWNKDMPNEDSQMDMMNQEVIRWVTGSWSRCSVSCDGQGTQSRFVRCEKLENRYYYQLDEAQCIKKYEKKPESTRACIQSIPCPKWIVSDFDQMTCTNRCLEFGQGSVKGDLSCLFENQKVDYDKCDQTKKPFLHCENPQCTVKWKISGWTKCSRSCGEKGIQARYLMCVWNTTNDLAGDRCYKAGLEVPQVLKSCSPPKCRLDCVDLFQNCKRKQHYCHLTLYNFRCCKTCRGYFRSLRNKPYKKKN